MEFVIHVDALGVDIPIPSSAKVIELGDQQRMQIISVEADIQLAEIEVERINAVVRKQGGAWVLDDGYLDMRLHIPIEGLPAPLDRAKRTRVTPDGLEFELPAAAAWGSFADSATSSLAAQRIIARRNKDTEPWHVAPSPRSFDVIDDNLGHLDATRCGGLDLRGVRIDRQRFELEWLPVSSGRVQWAVAVTGMASIARDTDALLFPIRRLHVSVEGGKATVSGSAGELRDETRALTFERQPGPGKSFEPTWPEQYGPLTPVLPSVPSNDVDPLQLAAGRLWLRSERGWVDVGHAAGDTRWPVTVGRSGLVSAIHPWFPSQSGLKIHALLDQVSTTFTVFYGGPTTVKLFGPPLLIELEPCAVFEPSDRKAPELPPTPGQALVPLLLVSDAWLPSSARPPRRFDLRHREGDWVLTAKHSEGVIDWRPSRPPLVGDPRWAANDPDAGVRCSAHRALIPRVVSSCELTLLRGGKGFSLPAPQAERPALPGVMRGLDRGWFGLEVEANDAEMTEGWRYAVAILDERYQSLVAKIAETQAVSSAPLAATRVHDAWLRTPQKLEPNARLSELDTPFACAQLEERLGAAPSVERIFVGDRPSGWLLVTDGDRWGVVRDHSPTPVVSIEPRTLERAGDELTLTADVVRPCTGSLVLRLRRHDDGWQIRANIDGYIEVRWADAFPQQSESRIQSLFLEQLKWHEQDGAMTIVADSVKLMLGQGRASYECVTTRKAALSSDADGKPHVRFEGPDDSKGAAGIVIRQVDQHCVVVHNHPLPGLMLQETLTPTDASNRFQLRINIDETDRVRPLKPEEFEARGDRVMFAFRDSLAGTPTDLLAAGLDLEQINLVYLELRREPHGLLAPVSGIIGWTIRKLAGLSPKVTCHATFKWSLEQDPSVELNGVWRWPVVVGGAWHEASRNRGAASLDVDLVLIDGSLKLGRDNQLAESRLFALASFELALREPANDLPSEWKWMGHVPLDFKPGRPGRPATLELWGSYRLGIRDIRKQGAKLQLRRGNFGVVLDPRVSNPSKSSCLIHVWATSNPAHPTQAKITATKQELAGHLAAPRELPDDPEIPRTNTSVEFVGNTDAPIDEPWLAELMGVAEDGATSWFASSASEWLALDPVASEPSPPRLLIIAPTGLSVLAIMPSAATRDDESVKAWARRVLMRSGWHREAILEDQVGDQLRWRIIDSPRLNRDLPLSWLDLAPRDYAALPGPVARRVSWSDRKHNSFRPSVEPSNKPAQPTLTLDVLAARPSCEQDTSPVVLGLELDPGVDDLFISMEATILRMSWHTPLAWDQQARQFASGWRSDVAGTGWMRESEVAPPEVLSTTKAVESSARPVNLELRTAAPRPGELLDLELEAWVTYGATQRSSGRHERRIRTSRAGPGGDRIEVQSQTDDERTEVRWVRRHPDQHDLGELVVVAHEPRAVDADPRAVIRIWVAVGREMLERLRATPRDPAGAAPRVWLTLRLETSVESGLAKLTGAADEPIDVGVAELRAGHSHDITDRLASSSLVALALELPPQDGHSRLTISADLAVNQPEQPSVPRVALVLRSGAAGPPPSTVAVFERIEAERSLLAVGPEPASAWRPTIIGDQTLVWQQVGSWTHHHPPGCHAESYAVGVLSSIGAWSCSDPE